MILPLRFASQIGQNNPKTRRNVTLKTRSELHGQINILDYRIRRRFTVSGILQSLNSETDPLPWKKSQKIRVGLFAQNLSVGKPRGIARLARAYAEALTSFSELSCFAILNP